MKYLKISLKGVPVQTKRLSVLRTLIRKGKLKEATYECTCRCGNVHLITFTTKVHSGSGYGRKPGKSRSNLKKRTPRATHTVLQTNFKIAA